jgi:hypothetical protein
MRIVKPPIWRKFHWICEDDRPIHIDVLRFAGVDPVNSAIKAKAGGDMTLSVSTSDLLLSYLIKQRP